MQSWYGLKVVGSVEHAKVPADDEKVAAIPRLIKLALLEIVGAANKH